MNAPPEAQDAQRLQDRRVLEALLFAAEKPLSEDEMAVHLSKGVPIGDLIKALADDYAGRGVVLVRVAGKWAFRTAEDLRFILRRNVETPRRLSRAALETLAIIAYHQPVSRAQIEEIRGVSLSQGTLDLLLETGWIKIRGRRQAPGRPLTYGVSEEFLVHFGLESVNDLPGLDELKEAGLLKPLAPTPRQDAPKEDVKASS